MLQELVYYTLYNVKLATRILSKPHVCGCEKVQGILRLESLH